MKIINTRAKSAKSDPRLLIRTVMPYPPVSVTTEMNQVMKGEALYAIGFQNGRAVLVGSVCLEYIHACTDFTTYITCLSLPDALNRMTTLHTGFYVMRDQPLSDNEFNWQVVYGPRPLLEDCMEAHGPFTAAEMAYIVADGLNAKAAKKLARKKAKRTKGDKA